MIFFEGKVGNSAEEECGEKESSSKMDQCSKESHKDTNMSFWEGMDRHTPCSNKVLKAITVSEKTRIKDLKI